MNEKGEIFELEVEPLHDTAADKDCLCTCSDCATDDTGYGTDSDGINNRLDDDDDFHETNTVLDFDVENDLFKTENTDFVAVGNASADIQSIEGDIDSLFSSVNSKLQFDTLKTDSLDLTSSIGDLFVDFAGLINDVSTVSLSKKKSKTMTNPESSSKVVRNSSSKLHSESAGKRLNDSNCSCSSKESVGVEGSTLGNEKTVTLRLKYKSSDVATNTVELCEQLLGIVPGHYSSTNGNRNRRRDKRIKVRGLVPTGVSAKRPEINVGKW